MRCAATAVLLMPLLWCGVSAKWTDAINHATLADGSINTLNDNLLCWLRPEAIEELNTGDGAKVAVWHDSARVVAGGVAKVDGANVFLRTTSCTAESAGSTTAGDGRIGCLAGEYGFLSTTDDAYNGGGVKFTKPGHTDVWREISDYVGADQKLVLASSAESAGVDSSWGYHVYRCWVKQDTAANQPTFKKHVLHGYGAVRYNHNPSGASTEVLNVVETGTFIKNFNDVAGNEVQADRVVCGVSRSAEDTDTQELFTVDTANANGDLTLKTSESSGKYVFAADQAGTLATGSVNLAGRFHVWCLQASTGSPQAVYVDGIDTDHDGTNEAYLVQGGNVATGDPGALNSVKIGNAFEGDIVEMLVYAGGTAMGNGEMDRVANYLAQKYDLRWSLGNTATSYDSSWKYDNSESNVNRITIAPDHGIAAGGTFLTISGSRLVPRDGDVDGDSDIDGVDTHQLQNILRVTLGSRPNDFKLRKEAATASTSDIVPGVCSNPTVRVDNGFTGSENEKIVCRLPAAAGPNQDITVSWGGAPFVMSNWFTINTPIVRRVEPATTAYNGGDTVTIHGKNFGPENSYTVTSAGNAVTTQKGHAQVYILTKSRVQCTSVTWVSDEKLLCSVPAIPSEQLPVNKNTRMLEANVIVNAAGGENSAGGGARFSYSGVPAFYTCVNGGSSSTDKNTCFSCCRHECVVDEFAVGAKHGGHTYSHCDRECYRYCGYLS